MRVLRAGTILGLAVAAPVPLSAGQFGYPDPDVFARAEDRERARLLGTPCAAADLGRGCYRSGDRLIRQAPCTYRVSATIFASLPTDRCFRMEPARRHRGVWVDEFEGQLFIPEGAKPAQWPRTDPQTPGWREQFERARAATIWLDVGRSGLADDRRGERRRMFVDFIGRKTRHVGHYGHMGMSGHQIIVDRVIAARALD